MKEFNVNDGNGKFTMILPTNLNEITEDYLLGVTKQVRIAPYHAIIAIVYRCKLITIVNTARKKKDLSTSVIPIFVKANVPAGAEQETADMFKQVSCGDKLIIAGTNIEIGNHIVCPKNFITLDNIVRIYNSDNDFAKGIMTDQNYYYFVDFKLVPIVDVKGFYSREKDDSFVNPFIIVNGNKLSN